MIARRIKKSKSRGEKGKKRSNGRNRRYCKLQKKSDKALSRQDRMGQANGEGNGLREEKGGRAR